MIGHVINAFMKNIYIKKKDYKKTHKDNNWFYYDIKVLFENYNQK